MMIYTHDLFDEYINKNKTRKQIQKEFGVSQHELGKLIQVAGLKKRTPSKLRGTFSPAFQGVLPKDFLVEHYLQKNLSLKEICKKFNISQAKVRYGLKIFGLKKPRELLLKGNSHLKTKEALEKFANIDGLNTVQISELLDCTPSAVVKLFKSTGARYPIEDRYTRVRRNYSLRSLKKVCVHFSKKLNKILVSKRFRRPGLNECSEETKEKLSLKALVRMQKKTRETPNPAEIRTKQVLNALNVMYTFQVILDRFLVDFELKNTGLPMRIFLEMDSRYHHNLEEIIVKDKMENRTIVGRGFVLVRIWDDEISETKITELLRVALTTSKPALIRFFYPNDDLRRHPKNYLQEPKSVEVVCEKDL